MEFTKEKNAGRIGAATYVIILFLLMFFLTLRAERMEPDPGSLEMELGFAEDGFGEYTPPTPQNVSGGSPVEQNIIAAESPSDVQIYNKPTPPNPRPNQAPSNNPPRPQPNAERNEFDEMFNSAQNNSSGRTVGEQQSGNPDGRPNTGGQGSGKGYSTGNAFGNGDAAYLPKPEVRSGEDGKVVLQLCINRNGRVESIITDRYRGSTAGDESLYRAAREAAMKATFPSDSQAPVCRTAFITYNFIKGFAQ
jgi:TonB family protein